MAKEWRKPTDLGRCKGRLRSVDRQGHKSHLLSKLDVQDYRELRMKMDCTFLVIGSRGACCTLVGRAATNNCRVLGVVRDSC